MAQTTDNPYKLLKIGPDASLDEIEAAYDRLYSRYEPRAEDGDDAAVAMLERLNSAYDTLTDSVSRAQLDLATDGEYQPSIRGVQSTKQKAAPATPAIPRPRPDTRLPTPSTQPTIRTRRRSPARPRAVQPIAQPSRTPYIIVGLLALATLIGAIIVIMVRGGPMSPDATRQWASTLDTPLLRGDEERRGSTVATVNGRPVYQQDFDERVEYDKQLALADPFFSIFVGNFEGITGTRALDILRYDALDRLINLEILNQQAVKEGLFPDESQQRSVIEEAKAGDLAGGQSFEEFLKARNITEQQYNRRIMRNLIFAVMANAHMPPTGTDDERTEGFFKWICETRNRVDPDTQKPDYEVVVKLFFTVQENAPCTSGLPPDIPIPGIEPEPPEPISTPAGPVATPTQGVLGPPAP